MRKHLKLFVLSLMVLGLVFGSATLAAAVEIASITGQWQNPTPSSGITIDNFNPALVTARWGNPAESPWLQSGYNFAPTATPFTPTLGTGFVLGQFAHLNYPIYEPSLTSIQLLFNAGITGATPATLAAAFNFSHNETPNPAPDEVTVTPVPNQLFTIGSDTYYFHLMGFSQNGGISFVNQFITAEGQTNYAFLYGEITSVPITTPEPLTLLLLGLGLVGLAGFRKRF